MIFSIEDLRDQQVDQIEGLRKIVLRRGGVLHHVKPHGALYHLAMSDNAVAEMFADVIIGIDPNIVLVGMANSALMKAALKHGLSFQQEIFADRRYTESGLLVPRNEPNALITNVEEGIEQISNFIIKHPRDIDTICVHGDNKRSLAFAKAIYQIVQF